MTTEQAYLDGMAPRKRPILRWWIGRDQKHPYWAFGNKDWPMTNYLPYENDAAARRAAKRWLRKYCPNCEIKEIT